MKTKISVTVFSRSKRLHELCENYQLQSYRMNTKKDYIELLFMLAICICGSASISNPRDNVYIIQTGKSKTGIEYTYEHDDYL